MYLGKKTHIILAHTILHTIHTTLQKVPRSLSFELSEKDALRNTVLY